MGGLWAKTNVYFGFLAKRLSFGPRVAKSLRILCKLRIVDFGLQKNYTKFHVCYLGLTGTFVEDV